jgi:hypothetical protein
MPAKATYYMAERVRELLENWGRWPGWASGGSSRSTLGWLDDFVANKRVGDYGPTVPVMGGDAADTHKALGRMAWELSQVLIAHYTARGHVAKKLEDINQHREARDRISKRTYFRRLADAHPDFMERFLALRETAQLAGARNIESQPAAAPSVARRHRSIVSPKLALKTPEKSPTKQGDSNGS